MYMGDRGNAMQRGGEKAQRSKERRDTEGEEDMKVG